MNATRKTFLQFSAELTGYPAVELEGTGLVDEYQDLLEKQVGDAGRDTMVCHRPARPAPPRRQGARSADAD